MNGSFDILESDSVLVERYEELRSTVTGTSIETSANRGLALLMHKGMATWMEAWSRLTGPKVQSDSTCEPGNSAKEYPGVVTMLAQMTLSVAREVRRCN